MLVRIACALTTMVCLGHVAFADVLFVRPGSGYDTIQAAVDSAVDGDTILVTAGTFPGFEIFDRGLTIAALVPGTVELVSTIEIHDLALGRDVHVSAIDVMAIASVALELRDNVASVSFRDCDFVATLEWPTTNAAIVSNCNDVSFTGCYFRGSQHSQDPLDGGGGIEASASFVSLTSSAIHGGGGGPGWFSCGPVGCSGAFDGGDGGHGYSSNSSFLFSADCTFVGGDAGPGTFLGDDGEVGFALAGYSSHTVLLDVTTTGTVEGSPSYLSGTARSLDATRLVRDVDPILVDVAGVDSSEELFLLVSTDRRFTFLLTASGVLHVDAPTVVPFPPGSAHLELTPPSLPPGRQALTLHLQVLAIDGQGIRWLTEPASVVVVETQLVIDCNQNGIPDGVDISSGTSADCDGNGVPDECDSGGCSWLETDKFFPDTGSIHEHFGVSISIDGDRAVVSSTSASASFGSAYVYTRQSDGWMEEAQLQTPSDHPADYFGRAVSISGDRIVVGAPREDDNGVVSGAAYVFERTASDWVLVASLLASDGAEYAQFGGAVSIDGDSLLIGAPGDSHAGGDRGSVYAFRWTPNGWVEGEKLVPTSGFAFNYFGDRIAQEGSRAVIGAHALGSSQTTGSAHVFEDNGTGWTETARLLANDAVNGFGFGVAVDLSGRTIVVGSYPDGAYIFEQQMNGTWSEVQKLVPEPPGYYSTRFGRAVAIAGDILVVGASEAINEFAVLTGGAFVFHRTPTGWEETHRLFPSDGEYLDGFGRGAALGGGFLLVGAEGEDSGAAVGAVYEFAPID